MAEHVNYLSKRGKADQERPWPHLAAGIECPVCRYTALSRGHVEITASTGTAAFQPPTQDFKHYVCPACHSTILVSDMHAPERPTGAAGEPQEVEEPQDHAATLLRQMQATDDPKEARKLATQLSEEVGEARELRA